MATPVAATINGKTFFDGGAMVLTPDDIAPSFSFKNQFINGNYDFWQRGTTLAAYQGATAYLADRWKTTAGNTTIAPSQQSFTPGQTAVPGGPTYYHRAVVASVTNASSYALLTQAIEGIERFSGRLCTLSFWAKADAAKSVGLEIAKAYGSGGSAAENGVLTTSKALTTGWALYTYTFTVPNNTGKTVSTGNALILNFWFDCGSSFTSRGTIGQQSGTFDIAAVQLEFGAVATAFEQRPPSVELLMCQRYFRKSFPQGTNPANNVVAGVIASAVGYATGAVTCGVSFGPSMRSAPSVTLYSPNVGTPTNGQPSALVAGSWTAGTSASSTGTDSGFQLVANIAGATAPGAYYFQFNYTADAEL